MNLEERFYTSTEVAEILGVSLRSVYRYLEEGKLDAEVKTATGRHRFTKENILNFLYPNKDKEPNDVQTPNIEYDVTPKVYSRVDKIERPVVVEPVEEVQAKEPQEEEPVDWLAKFREAADKFKTEVPEAINTDRAEVSSLSFEPQVTQVKREEQNDIKSFYYRSSLTGLKDIAQNIDKSARKASVDYAFTMSAGLSLHKPIKPFSVLHVYVKSEDKDFFEKVLYLTPSDRGNSQLCLLVSDDDNLYRSSKEMHSLKVVSDMQLRKDLMQYGEEELAKELDAVAR